MVLSGGKSTNHPQEEAMKKMLQQLMKDESGASMIEYVLIASIISIGALAVMPGTAAAINGVWTAVTAAL
jgi:Flp pilus assembly pilin Flp